MYYYKATGGERTYFRASNRDYQSAGEGGFSCAPVRPGMVLATRIDAAEYRALLVLKKARTADSTPSSSWVWNRDLEAPTPTTTPPVEKPAEIEPAIPADFATREEWLMALIERLRGTFAGHGNPLPEKLRASCSFPSRGGMKGGGSQTIGQCWYPAQSASGHTEIFITPTLAEPVAVAEILVHELVHAALGPGHGHGASFKRLATKLGLEGKMTATHAGEALRRELAWNVARLGPYPHAELDASQVKKQTTRLIKVTCPHCDYSVRITRVWLDGYGGPLCPVHCEPMEE